MSVKSRRLGGRVWMQALAGVLGTRGFGGVAGVGMEALEERLMLSTGGITVSNVSQVVWNSSTSATISGTFTAHAWNGSAAPTASESIVVGIRDMAGHWAVGTEPQVLRGNVIPGVGAPGTAYSVSFSGLAVPSKAGSYRVVAAEEPSVNAMLAFEASADVGSATVGTLTATQSLTTWGPLLPFQTWDQMGTIAYGSSVSYNDDCPLDPADGTRSVSGCVPTAEAEVEYYWRSLTSMSFSAADAYTSSVGTTSAVQIDADSVAEQFPNFATLSTDLAKIVYNQDPSQMAALVFGLGIKTQANYSSSGTGAWVTASSLQSIGFPGAAWSGNWNAIKPTVISNIQAAEPVIVEFPGHLATIDGYNQTSGKFHVVLGWGGIDDGWYTLPDASVFPGSATTGVVTGIGYNLVPAAPLAAQLAMGVEPVNTNAGSTLAPAVTVDIEDARGNIVTTDNSLVTLSVASGPGALQGTVSVHAVNGVATFSDLSLATSGTYTLEASDGLLMAGISNAFDIAMPASKVVFVQQPGNAMVGGTLSAVTVQVEDANGNVITTDNSTVTLSVTGGTPTLQGTVSVSAVNGVATFSNLSLLTAGTYTLQAVDGVLTGGTSGSFSITAPIPTQVVFGQGPTGGVAGSIMSPAVTVDVDDVLGHVVAGNSSLVTLRVVSGPGACRGTLSVTAVNGVATFSDLSLAVAGTYTFRASDGALTAAVSAAFTITLPATQLIFMQEPTNALVGATIGPAITVKLADVNGHVVTGEQSQVTLSVASGNGALSGLLTVTAVNGIATFSNVLLSTAGRYTLQASEGVLAGATSAWFTITQPVTHLIVTGPDAMDTADGPLVKVYDAGTGNLNFSFLAYDRGFIGAVRVAMGDFNGDGVPDVVTATGAGGRPLVNIYDGKTGAMMGNFYAYSSDYLGGVEVAVADVTGSGHPEIITATDAGGAPLVNVFDSSGALLVNFWAYDSHYLGGVRISSGDFFGDDKAEIITSTAAGGQPLVNMFDSTGKLLRNCWGDDASYTGGLEIAVGAFNNDGVVTVATYRDRDQTVVPQAKFYNVCTQQQFSTMTLVDNCMPKHLRVAATDANNDGVAEIVTVPMCGSASEVEVFSSMNGSLIKKWSPYGSTMTCGMFVAAG